MTNLERIKKMSADEFISEFRAIKDFPFFRYFDFKAYLEGTSQDKLNYVRTIGELRVFPSEMELKSDPDAKPKICRGLEETRIFDFRYVVLADMENMTTIKVPSDRCEWLGRV